EQDPEDWWKAADRAMRALRARRSKELSGVRAVGLSGQMHGATLLGSGNRVLRPAILWNDGRSAAECAELERRVPNSRILSGNIAMPGFTAPKLLWVSRYEPEIFAAVERVLLPKDYLRFRMCGNAASDMSDSSGTLWMDVGGRKWSEELLSACGLKVSIMPELFEGTRATGKLLPDVAAAWGLPEDTLVAAGGGDNAAGAAGVGVARPGEAFLSLGTSGVYFAAADRYEPNPAGAVHTFCHCLPGAWHRMSVILSAASCLSWVTRLTGAADEASLLAEVEASPFREARPIFLPYLSGERTPHNDPSAQGVFFGLTHETTRADLGRAVLEGVAYAFADGQDVLLAGKTPIREVTVIGGGARSELWGRILASVLQRPLLFREGGEAGPAFGAARLARLAFTGEPPESVCVAPQVVRVEEPNETLRSSYQEKVHMYREIYKRMRPLFS
ncbi:MAG TPA: xylulokinase, partial [Fibrobacteria bacterium]|nr:xylulokinase [Fibrobacteria bacterium]